MRSRLNLFVFLFILLAVVVVFFPLSKVKKLKDNASLFGNCMLGNPITSNCIPNLFSSLLSKEDDDEQLRTFIDATRCESGKGICDGSEEGEGGEEKDPTLEKEEEEKEKDISKDPIEMMRRHANKKKAEALREVDSSFGESIDALKVGGMSDFGSQFCRTKFSMYEVLPGIGVSDSRARFQTTFTNG